MQSFKLNRDTAKKLRWCHKKAFAYIASCMLCVVTAIYHGLLVLAMLPFSLIGRKFFHRASDGTEVADHPGERGSSEQIQEVMTIEKDGKKALVTITRMPQKGEDIVDRGHRYEEPPKKIIVGDNRPTSHEKINYTTAI